MQANPRRQWGPSCRIRRNSRTLRTRGSDPNPADCRRIGFAIRYVPTYVKQIAGPRDSATLVRGVDNYHHFELEPRPKADLDPEAMEVHKRITEEANKILYRGTDRVKN